MKITQVASSHDDGQSLEITIETAAGTRTIEMCDGEPEDNSLARNFSDAWSITAALKAAYDAGKSGESLEIVKRESDGDDE